MPLSEKAQVIELLDCLAKGLSVARDDFLKVMKRAAAVFPGGPQALVTFLTAKCGLDSSEAADYVRGGDYPLDHRDRLRILKSVSDELYRR